MQTRSMTRKAMVRSSSLEPAQLTRSPAPQLKQSPTPTPEPVVQFPGDDVQMVEHNMHAAMVEHTTVIERAPAADAARQEMLSMMQAQAIVQVATQRDTEARLQNAVVATEARLHATAHALVEAHAKEQALETRRDLSIGIERALVEAHTKAHQQAMQAAHERLANFTAETELSIRNQLAQAVKDVMAKGAVFSAETEERIRTELAQAVNDVETKGSSYIEGIVSKRLLTLNDATRAEIDKSVERALARQPQQPSNQPLLLAEDIANLKDQLLDVDAKGDLLNESRKRWHDGAVAAASMQAQRIVVEAENRLAAEIERRLSSAENETNATVKDALARAETHCNVIDKRSKESVDRAIKEMKNQRQLKTEVYVGRVIDEKIKDSIEDAVTKQLLCPGDLAANPVVEQYIESRILPRLQALVADAVRKQLEEQVNARIKPLAEKIVREQIQQHLANARNHGASADTRQSEGQIKNELHEQLESVVPRIDQFVRDASSRLETALERQLRPPLVWQPYATVAFDATPRWTVAPHQAPQVQAPPAQMSSQLEQSINDSLARSHSFTREDNQAQHNVDLDRGVILNPQAVLAARERAKSGQHVKPEPLSSTRADELKRFVRAFERFRDGGGREPWIQFVKPGVLGYLRSVECPENFSDAQIFEHLARKVKDQAPDVDALERKLKQVTVDPRARTSREKVESVLLGVESVVLDMAMSGDAAVPLATHISVVMEKLPRGLQTLVERRMKFSKPVATKREFAQILLDEAAEFAWPPA